jgi:hypothetical protein
MAVLMCVSSSIAGHPGERLVGVDAASRITLKASHQARPLDRHGQLSTGIRIVQSFALLGFAVPPRWYSKVRAGPSF